MKNKTILPDFLKLLFFIVLFVFLGYLIFLCIDSIYKNIIKKDVIDIVYCFIGLIYLCFSLFFLIRIKYYKNKIFFYGSIVLSFLVCSILLILFIKYYPNYYFQNKYNQTTWKEYSNTEKNPRGVMLKDLFENKLHKNMSKKDIIDLLGEPDHKIRESQFRYYVGYWRLFRIDTEVLTLEFSDNGQLEKSYCMEYSLK